MNKFLYETDIALVKELMGISYEEMAKNLEVERETLSRWRNGKGKPTFKNLSRFYDFAFKNGIRINSIKAQLHKEMMASPKNVLLFHGAKSELDGQPSLKYSSAENDFGKGFYCGETLEQSAMFVSGYPDSSIYIFEFNPERLQSATYHVNQDWMLTIAWYRGKLNQYSNSPIIKKLIKKLEGVDYIIAPIADNRMFEILNNFIDGEITDVQCQHCLSATNLGNQYVLISDNALKQLECKERCFLSATEKSSYSKEREAESAIGADKVKVARRQFRGQGKYIDEVLS